MNRAQPALVSLLVAPEPPDELSALVAAMRPWCVAVADESGVEPAAYVATSTDALDLKRALRSGKPVAIWARNAGEAARARDLGATVVLSCLDDTAVEARGMRVPPCGGIDVDEIPAVLPFVRARHRRAGGLPDWMVVDFRETPINRELWPTALGVCAACVVTGELLLSALAWGAPAVTDAASAAMVGARDGVEVAVAADSDLLETATDIAADLARAAALSRAGRRLLERRYSRARVAPMLADLLGLQPSHADGAYARLEAALNRLQTPSTSFVRGRARRALVPLKH